MTKIPRWLGEPWGVGDQLEPFRKPSQFGGGGDKSQPGKDGEIVLNGDGRRHQPLSYLARGVAEWTGHQVKVIGQKVVGVEDCDPVWRDRVLWKVPQVAARPWQVGQWRLRHELNSGCSRPQPSQAYMCPPSTAVRHASMSAMTLSWPASMRPSRRSRKAPPAQRRISAAPARLGTTAVQLRRIGKPERGWSRASNILPVARA